MLCVCMHVFKFKCDAAFMQRCCRQAFTIHIQYMHWARKCIPSEWLYFFNSLVLHLLRVSLSCPEDNGQHSLIKSHLISLHETRSNSSVIQKVFAYHLICYVHNNLLALRCLTRKISLNLVKSELFSKSNPILWA